jgi:Tol biopolymer transport system component/DNA-binding winged helix-turn-helix (wHTH) protein
MNSSASFRLGDWLVQPDLNRVTGPDGEIRLEPRVMLVLVQLAAVPGQVVSRDTLLEEVWEGTFVGEESLTRAISDLRRVFGDDARRPAYIETIRQRGYRLIAEVGPAERDGVPAATPPAPAAPDAVPPEPSPRPAPATVAEPAAPPAGPPESADKRRPFLPWGTVAALAVILLLFLGQRLLRREEPPVPAALTAGGARVVPLTTCPGHERQPALTADGTRVAFAWAGSDGDGEGIWVKQRNSETPLRLSRGPGLPSWPSWSPDGQTVAWVQSRGDSSEIRTVPGLGGAERVLLAVPGVVAGLDWAPDGEGLYFAARDTMADGHRLHRLDLATLAAAEVPVVSPPGGSDIQPRMDPDGGRLAWIHLDAGGAGELWTSDRDGGRARALVSGLSNLAGLAWSADGARLVFAAEHAGMFQLWSVAVTGGEPRQLTGPGDFAWHPAVAREAGDLVFEQVRVDQDLWRIRVRGRDPWRLETDRFLASTRWEYEADYSPDGARIAFVSARSGVPELWVCDRDGADPHRVTDTGPAAVTRPRWSPDGTRIAHNLLEGGRTRVQVVPLRGGATVVLTPPGESETLTGWVTDGSAVETVRREGDDWVLRRREVADGARGALVETGVTAAAREPAGGLLVVRTGVAGIWRQDAAADEGFALVVRGLTAADRTNWRPAGDALFWVLRTGGRAYLMVHHPTTGHESFVTDLPRFAGTGLAVAPDGSEIIYPRLGSAEGDLMLIPAESALPEPSSGRS